MVKWSSNVTGNYFHDKSTWRCLGEVKEMLSGALVDA